MACTEVVVHRAGRNLGLYLTAAATFAGCAHLGPNTVAVDRFRWVIRYVPEFEKRWNRRFPSIAESVACGCHPLQHLTAELWKRDREESNQKHH